MKQEHRIMRKLTDNEIKKALECCIKSSHFGECFENKCPAVSEKGCKVGKETLYPYALDLINRLQEENEELQTLVNDMGDYFPACIDCEGKTPFGERTDKCVYLLDNTNYCIKRGISNIIAIQKENRLLKEKLKTAKAENLYLLQI